MKAKKLVCGVGVNDSDSSVYLMVDGKQRQCPYYQRWINMMKRAYSAHEHKLRPTYVGCSVHTEWHKFSAFRSWMELQDWQGMHLDKDIIIEGNKVYSSETCVFVTRETNLFLLERKADRGAFPIGVTKDKGRYRANVRCGDKLRHLGNFTTPEEAHQAWRVAKYELAVGLASEQTDPRVAAALIERYKL